MSRFNSFLHTTGDRLTLPRATRSQILVEIASDLEDLFQHYLDQGRGEEEAAKLAEERVDMSDEALAEMVRIHSEARGWPERIFRVAHTIWERIAMGMIVLVFTGLAILETELKPLSHTTGFIWPIAGILFLLVGVFIAQLTRSSDHPNPRRLREKLVTPLFLGAASIVVGITGAFIDMYRALMAMVAKPDTSGPIFARAILENTSTLALALLVAMVAGIFWFVLAERVTRIEDAASRKFLEERR